MSTEVIAPKDVRDAFAAYTATDEYANSAKWALVPEHTKGSLWAAFAAGWNARVVQPSSEAVSDEELREVIALEVAKWDQPAIRTSKDLAYWSSARWYQLADNIRALLTHLRPAAKEGA